MNLRFLNAKWILVSSISVFILIHLIYINLPPCSIHVWRQCNTLAVAQNFYDEGYNILTPRVDRRFDSDGITGTAFPLYEWMLAILYKFTGVHYWIHRLFSLIISVTAVIFSYKFLRNIFSNVIACSVASSLLLWSPEFFYHSINAIPDILALCFGFISLFYFTKNNRHKIDLSISFLFLTLSGLIKLQYLMIGVFYLSEFIKTIIKNKNINRELIQFLLLGLFTLFIVLSWYQYSLMLIEKSNLRDIGIEIRSADSFSKAITTLKKNIISDFPELVFGYGNTLILLIGIYQIFINRKNKYIFPFLLLFIVYCLYHTLELRQMDVHQYYMIPIYFSSIAILYAGVKFLFDKKRFSIILVLLIAQPVLACIRIIPARWGKSDLGISSTFSDEKKLNELKSLIPSNAKVIAGPDESGCIYLYFLHKKGFGYERGNQLSEIKNEKPLIEDYINRGATYLVTTNESDLKNDSLKKYFQSPIRFNDFYIIRIKNEK